MIHGFTPFEDVSYLIIFYIQVLADPFFEISKSGGPGLKIAPKIQSRRDENVDNGRSTPSRGDYSRDLPQNGRRNPTSSETDKVPIMPIQREYQNSALQNDAPSRQRIFPQNLKL